MAQDTDQPGLAAACESHDQQIVILKDPCVPDDDGHLGPTPNHKHLDMLVITHVMANIIISL
jgi:hypothetical protein